MTAWDWADKHPVVAFLCLCFVVAILADVARGVATRRRHVTVKLENADVAFPRGDNGDRPS